MDVAKFLEEVCALPGQSGFETPVASRIAQEFAKYSDRVQIDALGNVRAEMGSVGPTVLVCAHMDEVGMIVTGIEDNREWFAKWEKKFNRPNLEIRLRPEGEEYENAIFEDGCCYDLIAVDGKRRAECAAAAVKALAPGGLIILDDSDRVNTSRDYARAIAGLKAAGLLQVDFYGFCPMNCYAKCTSLFFSRDFAFETTSPVQPVCGCGSLWAMSRRQRKEFYKKFG